jgi:hypothetical protein
MAFVGGSSIGYVAPISKKIPALLNNFVRDNENL